MLRTRTLTPRYELISRSSPYIQPARNIWGRIKLMGEIERTKGPLCISTLLRLM